MGEGAGGLAETPGVVVEWMRQNMQEVLSTDAAGLPIRQYMNWDAPADIGGELARFDKAVALLAGENCPALLPTGEFVLRLYWMPLSQTAASLKTFVHVYGAFNAATGSALWTQDDQFPQEGRLDLRHLGCRRRFPRCLLHAHPRPGARRL